SDGSRCRRCRTLASWSGGTCAPRAASEDICVTRLTHPGARHPLKCQNPLEERMRLTVLGKSPSWQDADGACSGYLIEEDGTAILLDCGNGVFSKLRRFRDYTRIDAVVISHLHADHLLD